MKILNLYAGIGGNRKLWGDEHEITAVEYDPAIAEAYQDRFPNDKVIVCDAKQYLLDHYKDFDFIWASPPCQSHSAIRLMAVKNGQTKPLLPDMSMYQVIIFLRHFAECNFVVENVKPYYAPVIKQDAEIDRHLYWSNFIINPIDVIKKYKIQFVKQSDCDIDLSSYKIKRKDQVIRNQVDSDVARYILECALDKVQHKQGGLF